MYIDTNKATMTNKCTSSAGRFDGHGGVPEQYKRHCLRKPLDAGIGWLLALYCPSGHQGNRQTNNNQQMHLKRWLNWWPWQCAGTVPCILPNGGGLGLCKMPLNTTIGRVLRPIEGNETKKRRFFSSFLIIDPLKRGSRWRQGPW